MENILGRQLWDVYENLKKGNRIGFLTDDEFQKYFLGFISYKYLSEKLESYIGNQLRYKSLDFEEAYGDDGYRESLRERSIEDIGYFLRPDLLFKNIVSSKNYGNIIIEELEKAFNEISESSRGRESEEDFLNLFEGVDLKASQLGKTLEDKNRAVFNILDALSYIDFDLSRQNMNNSLINKSLMENRKFKNSSKNEYESKLHKVESLSRKRSYDADLMEKNYSIESLSDSSLSKNMVSYLKEPSFNDEADYLDMDDYFYEKYIDELIGNGFEYLLSEFSLNSSNSLDYYTPKEVSKLIARLISSQKDHIRSVYDPCCGSASLLLEINKELPCDFICGQEINASFYNIARENMILHNIHYKDFDIKQGDSLEEPQHLDYTFEAIVSEIPFNSRWMADRSYLDDVRFMDYNILAPRTKADYAFIQHMLYHLDEDGIMIVVVPHGVLFRAASELAIRKQIVGRLNYLDAVIGLPANMFYSTNIPTCLMIFKKNRSWNDDVLFIDASRDFEKSKLIKYLSDKDISKIVETYRFRDEIRKYSHRASLDEIIENDFNLNIPRYVDTFEEKRMKSSKELLIEHQNIKEEIKKVTKEINMAYKELNIDNNLFE
ncbi:MAG: type I restriction-modification system subunit M [Methanobrevibacter sp.]|nr:type I restriction-modification system subunit M [Methanobrevibacter sp.]